MRNISLFLGALALTFTAAAGCDSGGGKDPEQPPVDEECHDASKAGCVVRSDKQRIQNPDVPAADLDALVTGNTEFALDLYKQLKAEQGNLFYSPYSISAALGMTWAGARGKTETEMADVLGFTLGQEKTHAAFNALDLALESRGENAKASDGKGFRLRVANAMWAQTSFPFEAPFLDTLGIHYGAGVHVVDFESATSQAIDLINEWVDDQTEGKIKKLVTPEVVTKDTRFVLTNAIYFNAAWQVPFEKSATKSASFTLLDGSTIDVPMMNGYQDTLYAEGTGYKAVSMPYDGNELDMVLVLPDAGTFADFESALDVAFLDELDDGFEGRGVTIAMPTFEFDGEFNLTKVLHDMGMPSAFEDADFSGMTSADVVITDVVHKAFVSVNEAGTEAAAATAVIGGRTSAPEPASITLDHPFLFLIRDKPTGSVLFVGRVTNPAE